MFRPVSMLRLSLVVLERDERTVLRVLGRLGVAQLTRTPSDPETAPLTLRDRSGELTRCDRLLTRVEELRSSLEIAPLTEEPAELTEMTLAEGEEGIRRLEAHATGLLERRQRLLRRWGELTTVCEQVSSYGGLELPLDQFDRYSFLHFVTGNLPAESLEKLQNEIADNVALLPLSASAGRQPIIAMTTFGGRAALESALHNAGFARDLL